ncbi:MAG: type II toxin-antitoxin system death-on-curing family toxin [Elusimicrobia bacterium]|nr:type II toxin-antitoxin system death-on-curing family toxin [Elusimicrobiota bacterium]
MKRVKRLYIKDVQYLAFKLAQEHMAFNESIPDFSTRFPNILESCLATPFQSFMRKSLYPDLISKASILFYLMIKNHPFQNGNKRIAMTALFVFLHRNNKWLKVDAQELYNFAMYVTTSPSRFKEQTVKAIEKFIKDCLVNR